MSHRGQAADLRRLTNLLSVSRIGKYKTALDSVAQNPRLSENHTKSQSMSSSGGVWCLDLPSHPFTLGLSCLQGWFSRGSPENSNFKSLSPGLLCLTHCVVSHWWVTNLWLSFHVLVWLLGSWSGFPWMWHKVSDVLGNQGSRAHGNIFYPVRGAHRWARTKETWWGQHPFLMLLCGCWVRILHLVGGFLGQWAFRVGQHPAEEEILCAKKHGVTSNLSFLNCAEDFSVQLPLLNPGHNPTPQSSR